MKVFITIILFTLNQYCNGQFGRISGIITDSNNNLIPFANIILSDSTHNLKYTATDFDGNYAISQLIPGTYILNVSNSDFNKTIINITIYKNKTTRINLILDSTDNKDTFSLTNNTVISCIEKTYTLSSEEIINYPDKNRIFSLSYTTITPKKEIKKLPKRNIYKENYSWEYRYLLDEEQYKNELRIPLLINE